MKAGRYDLEITKGATFRYTVRWRRRLVPGGPLVVVDLSTGWVARAQVRQRPESSTALISFSSLDDSIVLGEEGTIELLASADTTGAVTVDQAYWALEVEDETVGDGMGVEPLLHGEVHFRPDMIQ